MYRPPHGNVLDGIECLDDLLPGVVTEYDNIIILGDLNINFLIQDNKVSQCFKSYGLTQVIVEPTRITETSSTLLDPIFLSEGANCVEKGTINADMLSDHQMVYCSLFCGIQKQQKFVTFRDYKNFNIDNFNKDLHQVPWDRILYLRDVESKLRFLTENINMLFDLHCPIRTVRVTRPKAPWLTSNLKLIFKERNRALSKFKNNPSPDNWNNYKSLRNFALMSLRNEKSAFLNHLQHQKNSSLLYKSLKNMHIQANKSIDIPQDLSDPHMVNDYFTSVFQNSDEACTEKIFFYRTNTYLQKNIFSLKLVSLDNVQAIIHSIKSNASGMDGITLQMLKLCFPAVGIYLLHIINICLEKGYFPEQWKTAVVTPLPKISNPTSVNELRPISLLPLLSKILERVVYVQILDHLNTFNIVPTHQSGFQKNRSTTTALTYLSDSIISSLDKKYMSLLVLLDFSKAFDTLNHRLLVAKCHFYGFDEVACNFIRSYLKGRRQKVSINNKLSSETIIESGVPQGSVLGPLLFILYTADLQNSFTHSHAQFFADDTQMKYDFRAEDLKDTEKSVNEDLDNISRYCSSHNLRLNPSKCSALLFGNKKLHEKIKPNLHIRVNNQEINFTCTAKNLGIYFDSDLRFESHLNYVLKSCYLSLRLLFANKQILNKRIKKDLCQSLVISKMLYGVSIYYPCLTATDSRRLQIMQNTCVRFIENLRKFDHVSYAYYHLEWLNIQNLFKYSLINFTHRIMLTSSPSYLRDKFVCRMAIHERQVRFRFTLTMPIHRTTLFRRSFTYNAIHLYNSLKQELKTVQYMPAFKRKLKSFLLASQYRHNN
nr:unnamed protein product [Callosobruchus chinensis]